MSDATKIVLATIVVAVSITIGIILQYALV